MARDRNRSDDPMAERQGDRPREMNDEEQVRGGAGEDVRGIAGEEDEEFEDAEDLDEEDEDAEGSY